MSQNRVLESLYSKLVDRLTEIDASHGSKLQVVEYDLDRDIITKLEQWHVGVLEQTGATPLPIDAILDDISDNRLKTLISVDLQEAHRCRRKLNECLDQHPVPGDQLTDKLRKLKIVIDTLHTTNDDTATKSESLGDGSILASRHLLETTGLVNAKERFDQARDILVTRISCRLLRKSNAGAQYFPRLTAREVFQNSQDEVKSLYTHALGEKESSSRQEQADVFYRTILGLQAIDTGGEIKQEEYSLEHSLCDVLAMFIWYNVEYQSNTWKVFERLYMTAAESRQIRDGSLPAPITDFKKVFSPSMENLADTLHTIQWLFCPVVLRKYGPEQLVRSARLPYLEEPKLCNDGASARVYKVKVAKGHLQSRYSSNRVPVWLAQKVFRPSEVAKQAGSLEQSIHERFIQSSLIRHGNISRPLISLRVQREDSIDHCIFFRLADFDLRGYMEHVPRPDTTTARRCIFQQIINLASALDFLHNGIQPLGYSRASCHHLDLKPENILVDRGEDGAITFKITDFGFSALHFRAGQGVRSASVAGKGTAREDRQPSMSYGSLRDKSTNRDITVGSTYMSPEAMAEFATVSSCSDVWAFGAIICTVMAWLNNGHPGVQAFSRNRIATSSKEGSEDYFFRYERVDSSYTGYTNLVKDDGSTMRTAYYLNPAVVNLFKSMRTTAILEERVMYEQVWPLLQDSLLLPDPRKRTIRMDEVRRQLWRVLRAVDDEADKSRQS